MIEYDSARLTIERAGILSQPAQPAPLSAMWLGREAFEGDE